MVDDCRKAHREAIGDDSDLLFGLQLTHSGRYSYRRPVLATHDPLLDPRTIADKKTKRMISAGLSADLRRRAEGAWSTTYVAAARLARAVGFDFVDVKQCHRYLLSEFLGARNRPGPYGGSYENRTRLARDIIHAVRAAVPDVILATRINVYDGIPFHKGEDDAGAPDAWTAPLANGWGMSANDPFTPDLTEPLRWIGEMRALGVALVNVSMGNPYAQPHYNRPFEYPPPDGYESPEHPLIGADRHFKVTETIQRAFPDLPDGRHGVQLLAGVPAAGRRRQPARWPRDVRRPRPRVAGAARLAETVEGARQGRPQTRLPDVQLLHGPDAGEGPPARPVSDGLSAVRQGGVWGDLEGSARVECEEQI